jgi:hypothetical protein
MGWWQDLKQAGQTEEGPWSPSQAVVAGVKKLGGGGDMSWAGNANYGVRGTPEQKISEQNRNSQEQKTPSAAAGRPTQKPEAPQAPQVGFGIQGMNAGKGQGVAVGGATRYEAQGDEVRKSVGGASQPMGGAVSYLSSAPVKSMQEQNANVANGGGYSNEAMHAQGMNRLRAGLPYSEADYKAHMENERKTQLEDAALRGNDAALKLLGIGVERDKVTTDADVKRESNAGLKSYWDGKIGVEREQVAAQERIAKTKGAPNVQNLSGKIPSGLYDSKGDPILIDSGDYVQDGEVVPGLGRTSSFIRDSESAGRKWGEDNSGFFKGLFGMNPTEDDIKARIMEEMQNRAPGWGIRR